MPNPYNYNLPAPAEMFYGRGDIVRRLAQDLAGPSADSYALVGGRRFGKSSFLMALQRELQAVPPTTKVVLPVYLDLLYEAFDDPYDFNAATARYLAAELPRRARAQLDEDEISRLAADHSRPPQQVFEDFFVHLALRAAPNLRLVLLLDESEVILEQAWAPELFRGLRALLYSRPAVRDHLKIVLSGAHHFLTSVEEQGSPLRNILKVEELAAIPAQDARALVSTPTGGALPAPVVDEVVRLGGGHPFLLQYIMANLWDEVEGELAEATVELAREVAFTLPEERADFESWSHNVGPYAQRAYALLAERGGWVTRREFYRQIGGERLKIRRGLAALGYHGLTVRRRGEHGQEYAICGELFRAWFLENADLEDVQNRPAGQPIIQVSGGLHVEGDAHVAGDLVGGDKYT